MTCQSGAAAWDTLQKKTTSHIQTSDHIMFRESFFILFPCFLECFAIIFFIFMTPIPCLRNSLRFYYLFSYNGGNFKNLTWARFLSVIFRTSLDAGGWWILLVFYILFIIRILRTFLSVAAARLSVKISVICTTIVHFLVFLTKILPCAFLSCEMISQPPRQQTMNFELTHDVVSACAKRDEPPARASLAYGSLLMAEGLMH